MKRISSLAIVIVALTGVAHAQGGQAELAAQLNEEGKVAMREDRFPDAVDKFQQAVARVPESKYFVNLCTALLQTGKFGLAWTACDSAGKYNPTDKEKEYINQLFTRIHDEAVAQGVPPPPGNDPKKPDDPRTVIGGGGDGNPPKTPPEGTNQPPVEGKPLAQSLVAAGPPDNHYTWTLGAEFFAGGGKIGQPDFYGTAITGLRIKADYLLNQAARLGGQGYLQISHLGQGKMDNVDAQTLDIFDVGVAAYKDLCPGGTPRLCFRPLIGVHASFMSPAGETDGTGSQVFNYFAVGGRAELSMDIAFGQRYEHVLSVQAGVNVYSAVLQGPSADEGGLSIADVGLDAGGAAGYLGLGYTYRFNTPLGRAPFIILE